MKIRRSLNPVRGRSVYWQGGAAVVFVSLMGLLFYFFNLDETLDASWPGYAAITVYLSIFVVMLYFAARIKASIKSNINQLLAEYLGHSGTEVASGSEQVAADLSQALSQIEYFSAGSFKSYIHGMKNKRVTVGSYEHNYGSGKSNRTDWGLLLSVPSSSDLEYGVCWARSISLIVGLSLLGFIPFLFSVIVFGDFYDRDPEMFWLIGGINTLVIALGLGYFLHQRRTLKESRRTPEFKHFRTSIEGEVTLIPAPLFTAVWEMRKLFPKSHCVGIVQLKNSKLFHVQLSPSRLDDPHYRSEMIRKFDKILRLADGLEETKAEHIA